MRKVAMIWLLAAGTAWAAEDFPKPYSAPCVERENVFEFTEKPKVKNLGNDKYEITFAVKGNCDVAAGIVDENPSTGSAGSPQAGSGQGGVVVRHLGAGVLGANAPAPFQKNSLKQTIYWNGKDDLDEYHKTPDKLKVRVMLGLKPEFDKLLGGTSPHNLPGRTLGLTADATGVYVMTVGNRGKLYIRAFGIDGSYLRSLVPPPAHLPEEKLQGMGYVEYEEGKRALHGTDIYQTISDHMVYPVGTLGRYPCESQPAVVGDRLYFLNSGTPREGSNMYRLGTDGSTDAVGISGRRFSDAPARGSRLAASPDGRRLYMTGFGDGLTSTLPAVFQCETDLSGPSQVFVGDPRAPGAAEGRFNNPRGIACDSQGRVYVADHFNNRIQVFSPEGKFLRAISFERPHSLCVHPKTGALYVQHETRVEGASVPRISKVVSLEDPTVTAHVDGPFGMMALDARSPRPRLWLSNSSFWVYSTSVASKGRDVLEIWEDEGSAFRKILDFDETARQADGAGFLGRWSGNALGEKVVCDPVRETAVVGRKVFDLRTGKLAAVVELPGTIDDIAFDKRGYMHCHFDPGFYQQGVGRLDPAQKKPVGKRPSENPLGLSHVSLREVPYDYGVEAKDGWLGVVPVKDQPGAKYFQDGIGANMRGDVVEQCNIYYAPKMDDVGLAAAFAGPLGDTSGEWGRGANMDRYTDMVRKMREAEKFGEEVYSIRRQPGIALTGATLWTFEHSGELRDENAALAGGLINGAHVDEDGKLYFVIGAAGATRSIGGKPFLAGRGGRYGLPASTIGEGGRNPYTGTLLKTNGRARFLWKSAAIPLDEPPARPPELARGWVEGAEWLYAGASPIVAGGCSCPTQRLHMDWYKRVYVPEQYRHSIGILDTNGNLIMHLGRYGNFDSGQGPKSKIPVGDGITMCALRFISGTDNYLCYEDNGERIVVLKLSYHAEESVGIGQ